MRTPKRRGILIGLLCFECAVPFLDALYMVYAARTNPHDAPTPMTMIGLAIWAIMVLSLGIPLLWNWSGYPGSVSILTAFRGLSGNSAGIPFIALCNCLMG